jgi:transcriptional regulator with XRE-family HTH domain
MAGDNPTILRMRLGAELRVLRKRVGLNLEDTSEQLAERDQDISPSKLSRLENGRGAIKLQDIRALMDLFKVENESQRELLLQMAREAKAAGTAAWWTDYESVLPSGLSTYVALEAAAARLLAFTNGLIEGLLQTPEVAHVLIQKARPTDPVEVVTSLVELRMQRQKALREDPRLELVTIMDEGALLRPIGGAEAMKRQIQHIVEVCEELPNVQLQVIPLSKGAYASQHGLFTLIEPRDPAVEPVAYVDSTGGNLYLQRPGQIQRFRRMFGDLQAIALDPEESLDLIRSRC